MDPLSITAACVSLIATITKTSVSVTSFVRSVRAARSDLDVVSRELTSLKPLLASIKALLEQIAEDVEDVENFPETLCKNITGILANCELVLAGVQQLVEKYNAPGIIKGSKWALAGSEDIAKLQLSLEAHKSALVFALEMVTLSVTKQIKADTSEIRDDTAAIKDDTTKILEQTAQLRAQLPDDLTTRPSFQEPDANLARYLDNLTSYAGTVCWSGEDSDTDDETRDDIEKTSLAFDPAQPSKISINSIKNIVGEAKIRTVAVTQPRDTSKAAGDLVSNVSGPATAIAPETFKIMKEIQSETQATSGIDRHGLSNSTAEMLTPNDPDNSGNLQDISTQTNQLDVNNAPAESQSHRSQKALPNDESNDKPRESRSVRKNMMVPHKRLPKRLPPRLPPAPPRGIAPEDPNFKSEEGNYTILSKPGRRTRLTNSNS